MKRRAWLGLTGRAGLTAILPGCAASSSSLTIDRAAVDRAGGDAYGIWQNGRWIAGRNPAMRLPSLSITKSLAALLIVRAIGEGWLDPDAPLTGILPEWRNDPQKRQVTVRLLVNQTAGFSAGVAALYRGRITDKGRIAISLPITDPPGTRFRYGPASDEILAEVLRRHLRKRGTTMEDLLGDLMEKIGLLSPDWRKDLSGNFYLSTGARFSVGDLGKLGNVVAELASGKNAAGLQARHFIDLASPRAANPMVAAGIWWNRNAVGSSAFSIQPESHIDAVRPPSFWSRACLSPGIDPGWLAMVGSGGKRVYVLPSSRLVVVRLARDTSFNDGAFLRSIT